MTAGNAPPVAQGWALTRLIALHQGMRDDLRLLRQVVTAVGDGHDAGVADAFRTLSLAHPGWSLRAHCASFCEFVRGHHSVEDTVLFPMLQRRPGGGGADLEAVLDTLKHDHVVLATLLDEAQRAVATLPGDARTSAAVAGTVERLADHLERHLDFEEEQLAPALNALSLVVTEDEVPAPPPEHLPR